MGSLQHKQSSLGRLPEEVTFDRRPGRSGEGHMTVLVTSLWESPEAEPAVGGAARAGGGRAEEGLDLNVP